MLVVDFARSAFFKGGFPMPVKMERALKRAARKKGLKGRRAARYVYGTMNKLGKLKRRKKR